MDFWLRLNMFFRSFFLQAGWNFSKYQNLGFTFIMLPFLRRLYHDDPDALSTVLQRYLDTFNTHPIMASFCFGALAKQEMAIAKEHAVTAYKEQVMEWTGTRRGLAITAASIGDRLFWGALKPLTLLLAIFVWMLLGVNFLDISYTEQLPLFYVLIGGLVAFFVYNSVAQFVRWEGLKVGYDSDESACFGLTRFDWNRTIYNAKRIGLILSCLLIVYSAYRYLAYTRFDIHFWARTALIVFFILLSLVTRKLRIANVYLYLVCLFIFIVICLF